MIKNLLTEWKSYINEELKNNSGIKYKSNSLKFFLETFRGIKQLRVPSWVLQSIYAHPSDDSKAVVAFDGWKPVGIGVLSFSYDETVYDEDDEENYDVGILNLYVDPAYRGRGIASQLFKGLERLARNEKYVAGGRRTGEMLIKAGYEPTGFGCESMNADIFYNKNY